MNKLLEIYNNTEHSSTGHTPKAMEEDINLEKKYIMGEYSDPRGMPQNAFLGVYLAGHIVYRRQLLIFPAVNGRL